MKKVFIGYNEIKGIKYRCFSDGSREEVKKDVKANKKRR